ncbi:glucan 1,3-beta-glucosidase [Cladochytrium replicatum]|nr:glucan 1,3-beta-glucosidase [Cladochytrium replicatum]
MHMFAILLIMFLMRPNMSFAQDNLQYRMRRGEIAARGVNLGSWLVMEHWMSTDSPVWPGVSDNAKGAGEFRTMIELGHAVGDPRFEQHRQDWIKESDIAEMKSFGINMVRVPVGYWIRGEDPTDVSNKQEWKVFAPGALKYLDLLVNTWAPKYEIAVLVDIHAAKGSQNGNDNSAPTDGGKIYWDSYAENVENTVLLAKWIADRYRSSPFFLGVGLLNEPWYQVNLEVLKNYYIKAYRAIRDSGNDCLIVVAPRITEQNTPNMMDFMPYPDFFNVWHEWHPYYTFGDGYNTWADVSKGIQDTANSCKAWTGNWLVLGEWSLAAKESAVASQNAGAMATYASAQLAAFANAHSGWVFWSWKRSGDDSGYLDGWSMRNMLRKGILKL